VCPGLPSSRPGVQNAALIVSLHVGGRGRSGRDGTGGCWSHWDGQGLPRALDLGCLEGVRSPELEWGSNSPKGKGIREFLAELLRGTLIPKLLGRGWLGVFNFSKKKSLASSETST